MDNDSDKDWLDSVMDRTSVTVDEAVYMLMGWADGPVITKTWSDTPTEFELEIVRERNARPMQLDEASDFVWACREGEYKDAKRRRRPAHVIAEKRAAMENCPDEIRQAKAYLCAIKDELNDGDSSALRIDRELSTGAVRYITRTSFERWAQDRFGISLVPLIPKPKDNPEAQARIPADEKPWSIHDPSDPTPDQPWYTPARYFARKLIENDSTLLTKRNTLVAKVAQALKAAGILKRGRVHPFKPDTVKKALVNVRLG